MAIHNSPDGTNINANCGSTHMEVGDINDGDQIMAIVGVHMKNQGKLKGDMIIATVMSNLGFFLMGDKNGIKIEQTKVGDRYVLERIKELEPALAENSRAILFFWMRIRPATGC